MLDQFFEDEEEGSQHSSFDSVAIGIDLGTTNTVVAFGDQTGIHVLADADGQMLLPSVVAYLPNGTRAVGRAARERRLIDPLNTILSAKRIIGQPHQSPRLQRALGHLSYKVIEGANQQSLIRTRAGDLAVPDVSAAVVEHAREIAHRQLGREISHCVITVPANFNDAQREATRRAATSAGLEVLRILNEPTAAALAYGRERELDQRIAVFDMGGGTFDVTVLAVRRGLYEVLATGGDPFLGGDDMDHILADALAERFLREHRLDPRADVGTLAVLMASAEELKTQLSSSESVEVEIPELMHGARGKPLSLSCTFTRSEFDELIDPIVERALFCAEGVLADADLLPQNIDEVLLVGGATYVPAVFNRVEQFFGCRPKTDINPMYVVAIGAAAHAQSLFAPETVEAPTHGQEDELELAIPLPGTALLLDVTSHPVGVATAGGFAEVLIDKNTSIPTEATRVFTTAKDNQESVILKICQGSDRHYANNEALGELTLSGIRPGPRGDAQIEVGFLIDADGVLQVSATDPQSGNEAKATLSLFGLGESPEP